MNSQSKVSTALLALRVSVFAVLLVWTLDKLVNPGHAGHVYKHFYFIGGLGPAAFTVIGLLELVLCAAFLVGYRKRLTYGLVLLFHGISTLSSYAQYADPFNSLLFFAAWPMLAACFALYYLRDLDTKWTLAA